MTIARWLLRHGRTTLFYAATLLAVFVCLTAQAGDSTAFRHRVWSTEMGAPADIWAMAQGKDGGLWLGTGSGLYRFDGFRFEHFKAITGDVFDANDITALNALPDGSLWVGFYYGGAAIIRDGHVHSYLAGKDFPTGMVLTFAQTPDGAMWAATESGLARFDGQRWQLAGSDWGYPTRRADWLLVGNDGTLWVTTGESLVFLRQGERRFHHTRETVIKYAIVAQAPDGTLWLSDHLHGTRALPGLTASHPDRITTEAPDDSDFAWANRLLFDSYGNLWGTRFDKGGIYRVASVKHLATGRSLRPADITESIDRTQGLVSDRAVPLLQDAEGTVWAGTNMSLASFHRNSFQSPDLIPMGTGANYGMAVDAHGSVWIANDGTLFQFDGDDGKVVRHDLHDVGGMLFDHAGDLWMIGRNQLFRLHGNTIDRIEWPVPADFTQVNALAMDPADMPWLALAEHGLYHLQEGRWAHVTPLPSLDHETPTALASDGHGVLWIGYSHDRLVRLDARDTRIYTAEQGMHIGTIASIVPNGSDVWIGGDRGLARWHDGQIASLSAADDDVFNGITGVTQDSHGDLWLNTNKGVLHMDAREVRLSFEQAGRHPTYRLFDYRDGLPGIARQASMVPTALSDGHARLWFLTNQGPAWTAPAQIRSNRLPPPVSIMDVLADGRPFPLKAQVELPKGTTNIHVRYSAASLAVPDRVRFRYQLEGIDDAWQDAGNRREAFYSNLNPGSYVFHVIAANDDGVWNQTGASITIVILPWFYQTRGFLLGCFVLVVLLVVMLFVWRTRYTADRVHLQLMERMSERERIARDIHDTLLQGVQGLLLRLQALIAAPSRGKERNDALKLAIDQARDMVIEGRDRIIALRGIVSRHSELAQSILAVSEGLAPLYPGVTFQMSTEGSPRSLLPSASEEILDIVREAVRNAFVHADARYIRVHVAYKTHSLRVRIADDGRGMPEPLRASAVATEHWGIIGMRERAAKLGAKLTLRRCLPTGSEWLLRVPCRVVYHSMKNLY